MVEVEAVHLGAHELHVILLRDRPAARVEALQPAHPAGQLAMLGLHRRRRVVGHALRDARPLEGAPLGEERKEILVAAASLVGRRGWSGGAGGEQGGEKEAHGAHHSTLARERER